jgi:hypothetical protein
VTEVKSKVAGLVALAGAGETHLPQRGAVAVQLALSGQWPRWMSRSGSHAMEEALVEPVELGTYAMMHLCKLQTYLYVKGYVFFTLVRVRM